MKTRFPFLALACLLLTPALAAAQGVCGSADSQACLDACAAYTRDLPEDDTSTEEEVIAHCVTLEACTHDGMTPDRLRSARSFCQSVFRRRPPATTRSQRPPAFCILPDGSGDERDGCSCPSGYYPISVAAHRSRDRLRSLGVPRGRSVFICYSPLAPTGAPGSAAAVSETFVSMVEQHDAALRTLCAPGESDALLAACTQARQAFLAIGSSEGPGDLTSIVSRLDALEELLREQRRDIEALASEGVAQQTAITGNSEMIAALSRRIDVIVQCFTGDGRREGVVYTDAIGTARYRCDQLIAAASTETLAEARRVAREEAERVVRESSGGGASNDAFAWFQAYGLVTFTPLVTTEQQIGNIYMFGGELTGGVSLGGGWSLLGGIGLGYSGPDIPGATNVGALARLGLGSWVDRIVMIGFGFIATHRFLPNVFSVHSVYGPYAEMNFRFLPDGEWSPIATIRAFVGASPRWNGTEWHINGDGGIAALIGIAHF